MEAEIWKPIPSQPEITASSLGRVCVKSSTAKMPHGAVRAYHPKPTYGYEQKTANGRNGVPKRMTLRVTRLKRTFKIARLVCEAFHGRQPSDLHIVMHLDENPSNNRPENLKWGTRKENQNFPKVIEAFKARTGERSCWAIHNRNKEERT